MIKKINHTSNIKEDLQKKGKLTVLNRPEHVLAIATLNEEMEEVRRDYKMKNQKSLDSAARTILTA